jgi:hypothetical protein
MSTNKNAVERELKTLLRRVSLLQGAQSGKVELRKITVVRKKSSWTVHARQKTYFRYIAPAGWKP